MSVVSVMTSVLEGKCYSVEGHCPESPCEQQRGCPKPTSKGAHLCVLGSCPYFVPLAPTPLIDVGFVFLMWIIFQKQ